MKSILNQNGVSLLEVLISVTILTVGLLGFAPMVVLSVEGNTVSRDSQAVANMARDRMEFYRGQATLPSLPFTEFETNVDSTGFDRMTTIIDSTSDSTLTGGLCQIDVLISWQDVSGVARASHYVTYLESR